ALPRQRVVAGSKASPGQTVLEPVHVSAMSQTPAAARQVAPAFPAGCWQPSLLPSHSSRLHGFPSDVQAVPAVSFASDGQAALDPVQFSARSQTPADARHTVLADAKPFAGHASLDPSHVSATSQSPATGRQTALLLASAEQPALEPVQLSARSQTPADARQ